MRIYTTGDETGLSILVEAMPDRVWTGVVAPASRRDDLFPSILLGWKGKTGDLMQDLLREAEGRGQLPQVAIIRHPGRTEIGYFLRLTPGNEVLLRKLFPKKRDKQLTNREIKAILVFSFAHAPTSACEEFMKSYEEKKLFFLTLMTKGTSRYKDVQLTTFVEDVPEYPEIPKRRNHH